MWLMPMDASLAYWALFIMPSVKKTVENFIILVVLIDFDESVTKGRTDGPTDIPGYRDVRTHLKTNDVKSAIHWIT